MLRFHERENFVEVDSKNRETNELWVRDETATEFWLAAAEPCPIMSATSFRNEVEMVNHRWI
jgi:hypothetical protein